MPKILPVRDLKNTAVISQICNESNEPIFITKNGYGDMVLMNMKLYEDTMAQIHGAALINESLQDVASGAKVLDGEAFFSSLREKYGR